MGASYVKYFLHKSSKPASYIQVRLIIRCVLYARKYGTKEDKDKAEVLAEFFSSVFTIEPKEGIPILNSKDINVNVRKLRLKGSA